MIRSDKKIRELSEILEKRNTAVISDAIETLREEKPFEGAIGLLTAFYDQTDDNTLRKLVSDFMNDLKDQSVCKEVIDEIRKKWKNDTISMLVSSCWQSGLDYAAYSADLARTFLKGDYVTAVECLTVIEESAPELTKAEKDEIIKILEDSPDSRITEKKPLTFELLAILER